MSNFIKIKINQTDISQFSNWQLDIIKNGTRISVFTLQDSKTNNKQKEVSCDNFTDITQFILTATTNILSSPKLTANSGSFSGDMEIGDSGTERILDMSASDWSNINSTTVLGNTIKQLNLSNIETYQNQNPIVTIDATLSNCSISPTDTTIELDGQSHILTLTPNAGYHFETVPKINVNSTDYNFTASGDSYTFDLNSLDITEDTTAIITATAIETIITYPKVTITKNLLNCTMSPDVSEVEIDGNSHILTITANNGYHFETSPTITIGETVTNFSEVDSIYTIDLNNLGITSDVNAIINANAIETIPDTISIQYNITNGEKSVDSDTTIDNTTISDIAVAVKADNGYTFDTLPILVIKFADNTEKTFELTYSQSRDDWITQTGSINFSKNKCVSAIVSGVAVEKTPIETDFGLLHVYKVNNEDLSSLSRIRFIKSTSSDEYADLARYIISIRHYPINLELGSTVKMQLGYYSTDIDVKKIATEKYIFNSNEILINGLYKNASDILHSEIKIYLPFHGYETIESKYINTTIKIITTVNILANNCIFNIYSDNNLILTVQDDNIADTLPYILKSNDNEININDSARINMFDNKMFIEVSQNAMVVNTNYSQSYVTNINSLNGFIKCNVLKEININNAMNEEIDEIKSILSLGIFI